MLFLSTYVIVYMSSKIFPFKRIRNLRFVTKIFEECKNRVCKGSTNVPHIAHLFYTESHHKNSGARSTDRPSPEKLIHVYTILRETLPKLFVQPMDYSIYHPQLMFVNNIRGTTTVGLDSYIRQMTLLTIVGRIKFIHVSLDVLKITMNSEDSSVKVRWRIRGKTGIKLIAMFWNVGKFFKQPESWFDGFSTFYVNEDGDVYKHVADQVMPSRQTQSENSPLRMGVDDLTVVACKVS